MAISMKFLKQRNGYSCGPLAIMNSLIWAGQKITYRAFYDKVFKKCKTDKDGTHSDDFEKALRCFSKKHFSVRKKIKNVSIEEIIYFLSEGYSIILSSIEIEGLTPQWLWNRGSSELEWHLSFWYKYKNGKFKCAQNKRGITRKQLEKLLENTYKKGQPEFWFLKRKF